MVMMYVFIFQGFSIPFIAFLMFQLLRVLSVFFCDCENYVQCVKYSVFGPVCHVSQCGCHTPPSADC